MITKYKLLINRSSEKQIKKLASNIQIKIIAAINSLAYDPFPYGSKKLSGFDDTYRIRIGNYRVIYFIQGKELIITVIKVGHRKNIYRF